MDKVASANGTLEGGNEVHLGKEPVIFVIVPSSSLSPRFTNGETGSRQAE